MVKTKIIEIISQITGVEKDYLLKNISGDKVWDSFQNVEIIFALESEFNITYTMEDMVNFTTIEKIIEITESRLNEK